MTDPRITEALQELNRALDALDAETTKRIEQAQAVSKAEIAKNEEEGRNRRRLLSGFERFAPLPHKWDHIEMHNYIVSMLEKEDQEARGGRPIEFRPPPYDKKP